MTGTETKQILLVEDEAIIALSQAQTLRDMGYGVETAYSGEDAVAHALSTARLDLILMDIDLGRGIDGTEAAERILAERHIPIVFLSSHSEPEMIEKVRGITRYGYVLKSSGEFILRQSINTALELDDEYREKEAEHAEAQRHLNNLERTHTQLHEREEALRRNNRSLQILRSLNRAAVTAQNDLEFLSDVCATLHTIGGYRVAWVGTIARKPTHHIMPVVRVGGDETLLAVVDAEIDASPSDGGDPVIQAVRTGAPTIVSDIAIDARTKRWRPSASAWSLTGVVVYPVWLRGAIWGVLVLYADASAVVDAGERELLDQIVEELAFSLDALHLRRESAAMEELLLNQRGELRERVKELRGLYQLSQIAEEADRSTETVIRRATPIIRAAFQVPEQTYVHVSFRGIDVTDGKTTVRGETAGHNEVTRELIVNGERVGRVVVGCAGRSSTEEERFLEVFTLRLGEILERVENSAQHRETERRLSMIVDGAGIGTWDWSVPTGRIRIDDRWAEMLGYVRSELEPFDRRQWMRLVHPADVATARQRMVDHLRGESEYYRAEVRMLHKVGEWRWILMQAQILHRDENGRPLVVLGANTDVTMVRESARSDADIASEAVEMAKSSNLMIREMHHRIKNDLNLIRSLFSLQASGARDETTRRFLRDAGNRIAAVGRIYEVLYHGDDLQYVRTALLSQSIVRDVRAAIGSDSTSLTCDVEDFSLPRRVAIPFGLVLNELVTNCLKYGADAGGAVTATVSVRSIDRSSFSLTVRDSGPGFSEAVLSGDQGGFGIMVMKALAEQHDGALTMGNRPDGGAETTVVFRYE